MDAATEVETLFVALLCQCCDGYRKREETEEEETAAFEQGCCSIIWTMLPWAASKAKCVMR